MLQWLLTLDRFIDSKLYGIFKYLKVRPVKILSLKYFSQQFAMQYY